MIDNSELPIGFTMELAQHSDIIKRYSELTDSEREDVIKGARLIRSRDEMRSYIENMF